MEFFIVLFVGGILLATPVLALRAFLHARGLELEFQRHSKAVDNRFEALGQRLATLETPLEGVAPPPTAARPEASSPAVEATHPPQRTPPLPSHLGRPTAQPSLSDRKPEQSVAIQLPPVPHRRTLPSIEWERWLGIRGAAVLGGVVLVIAGLLFFQHAIVQGWFGPQARIISGAALGVILMCSRGRIARVGHPLLADVLVGTGAVLQYGAAWSAYHVHHLVPVTAAFPWMLAATIGVCFLALRYRSATIATFGLVGGFATPLLLGTTANGPGLFAYLLLLDLGLIAIARKGRWALLGPLALAGTALLQARWLLAHATVETAGLGLLCVGVFALLFLLRPGAGDRVLDATSRLSALVVAALLAGVLAIKTDLGVSLVGLGPLLGVLSIGACAVAWLRGERLLATVAAAADGILAAAWLIGQQGGDEPARLWAWTVMMLGLLSLFAVYGRLSPATGDTRPSESREMPFGFMALATLATLTLLMGNGTLLDLGPLTTTAAVLLGLAGWVLVDRGARVMLPLLAAAVGGLFALRGVTASHLDPLAFSNHMPQVMGLGLGLLVLTWLQRNTARCAPLAAAALLVPVIMTLSENVLPYPLTLLILAALATASTTWTGSAWAHGIVVGAVVIAEQRWFSMTLGPHALEPAGPALAWAAGLVAVCTLGPLCAGRRIWRDGCALGRTAILAPLVWLRPDIWRLRELALPELAPATVPFALAAVSLLALGVVSLQRRAHPHDSTMDRAPTFAAAVTAGLLALGLARWAGPEWGTVTLALTGLAWTALGVKSAHPRLRGAGLVTLAAAGVTLLVTALMLGWYPRAEALLWNRISYSHLIPLGALAGGLALVRSVQDEQARKLRPVLGALVVLGIFAWINLLILQATGSGNDVYFELHRVTSRDLSMSLAWVLYSLVLLGLGTARRISGLRWMSLGITMLTVAKVFLYDLGNLQGMHRVGSLTGLAVCLLLVSFLYQRFVFGRLEVTATT